MVKEKERELFEFQNVPFSSEDERINEIQKKLRDVNSWCTKNEASAIEMGKKRRKTEPRNDVSAVE